MVRSISEIRREEIIEAVLMLLAEHGPRALNVQSIANQVGMAKASLYQHFNSVDEMVEGAILSVKSRLMEMLEQIRRTDSTPLERLGEFFRRSGELPTVIEALHNIDRLESKSVGRWREMMMGIRETLHFELMKDLQEAQAVGLVRSDLPAGDLLEVAFALYQNLKIEAHHCGGSIDLADRLVHTWQVFLRLIDKRAEIS